MRATSANSANDKVGMARHDSQKPGRRYARTCGKDLLITPTWFSIATLTPRSRATSRTRRHVAIVAAEVIRLDPADHVHAGEPSHLNAVAMAGVEMPERGPALSLVPCLLGRQETAAVDGDGSLMVTSRARGTIPPPPERE